MQTWQRGSLAEVGWYPVEKPKKQWILHSVCWLDDSKSQAFKFIYFFKLQACSHHTPCTVQLSSLSFVSQQMAWSSDFWIQTRVSCRHNGKIGIQLRSHFLTLNLTCSNLMHCFPSSHFYKKSSPDSNINKINQRIKEEELPGSL